MWVYQPCWQFPYNWRHSISIPIFYTAVKNSSFHYVRGAQFIFSSRITFFPLFLPTCVHADRGKLTCFPLAVVVLLQQGSRDTTAESHHLLSEIWAVPLLFKHLQFHCFKSWASLPKMAQLALFTQNPRSAPLLAAAAGLRRCCPGPRCPLLLPSSRGPGPQVSNWASCTLFYLQPTATCRCFPTSFCQNDLMEPKKDFYMLDHFDRRGLQGSHAEMEAENR